MARPLKLALTWIQRAGDATDALEKRQCVVAAIRHLEQFKRSLDAAR